MLVLPHADGLGVDLHQLRQRILQAAGDGDGGAQVHVVLREFLRRQLSGGVYRRARLVDDHVADPRQTPQHLHRHLLRLPAGGAVADGDMCHAVLSAHGRQPGNGRLLLPLAVGGIDHRGVQHLAGAVDDRYLAAVGIAGVKPHGHMPLHRRLEQQRLQVQGELTDSALAGALRQCGAGLPLQRGIDQPVVGILADVPQERHG